MCKWHSCKIKKDQNTTWTKFIQFIWQNLRFAVDTFDDGNIHSLDIKILNNGETDICIKDTDTGI